MQPLSLPTHSTSVICRATVRWTRKGSPEPLPVVQSSLSRSCTARQWWGQLESHPTAPSLQCLGGIWSSPTSKVLSPSIDAFSMRSMSPRSLLLWRC